MPASTKPSQTASFNGALQALTSAALILPGLMSQVAEAASENVAEFGYSHYQEGKRDLFNVRNSMNPIEVDSVHGNTSLSLTDRIKFGFNFTQDTWSGATPVATGLLATQLTNRPIKVPSENGLVTVGASPFINSNVALDRNLNPIQQTESKFVHIMAEASPETRQQGDFKLSYEWDNAALDVGGGLSIENDYESSYGSVGGRFDFNQKLTTVKWSTSFTDSDISAILDHDILPYLTRTAFADQIEFRGGSEILHGNKQDWAGQFGISQVLNKTAVLDANISYTHSSGFLENPYKAVTVIFVDPDQLANPGNQVINGDVRALLEQRPGTRNQWNFSTKYVQYIEPFDAALHFNYQFSHDDWGINAHVFDADWAQPLGHGWTVTPRIRYYSQSAANFYRPVVTTLQTFNSNATDEQGRTILVDADNPTNGVEFFRDQNDNVFDAAGNIVDERDLNLQNKRVPFDPEKLPNNFSSDTRLSGFGTLSGGITVAKQFAKGVSLEAGFEYYTHQGSLKLGGGGENDFADFDSFVANAALKVDLSAVNFQGGGSGTHEHAHVHGGHSEPAGVIAGHMLKQAGEFMVGYRFMYNRQDGDILHGTQAVSDQAIVDNGCSDTLPCRFTPTYMNMKMHMLNIMYAPADWLNLMLMPTFMDMEMNIRELAGRPPAQPGVHEHSGIQGHTTGGVGDTKLSALVALLDTPVHHVHMGLGLSAPTGNVDLKFRRTFQIDGGLVHFGMQLGSGTWDFLPSLTYTGNLADWFWGGQVSGITRLEDRNESGYRLGDQVQATSWGGYQLTHWLSATVRGIYTVQGAIKGDFNSFNARSGPMDFPANHGGRFWDVGFGLSASVPGGDLAGNSFSFEWRQPVSDDVNGFQLEREGALTASWHYAF
ncbi:MAG: hypothetical protein CVV13_07835 [Gammaproteobacteria bacterium HGW-Gammaproteobacteria-3]|nr:MAG: hypothetical protein CVV13_07835 [Gammaproteobacteria bacterium HGW-Gammaproteobacteria-3]